MFSYRDLVCVEIAFEVGDRFGVTIPDDEPDGWRTLGDAARSVASRAGERVSESEVFEWIRTLIAEGYGVSTTVGPDEDVFGDYDRMIAWFMASPYPHRLGDRWFATRRPDNGTTPPGKTE